MKTLLTWILFETLFGQVFLSWLENRADLAIVPASQLPDQTISHEVTIPCWIIESMPIQERINER